MSNNENLNNEDAQIRELLIYHFVAPGTTKVSKKTLENIEEVFQYIKTGKIVDKP